MAVFGNGAEQQNGKFKRDMLNQVIQRHPIFSQTDSMDTYIDYM